MVFEKYILVLNNVVRQHPKIFTGDEFFIFDAFHSYFCINGSAFTKEFFNKYLTLHYHDFVKYLKEYLTVIYGDLFDGIKIVVMYSLPF